MRLVRTSRVLLVALAALCLSNEVRGDTHALHPDLAFNLSCRNPDRSTLEGAFEQFLQREGFKAINQGRIQREHQIFSLDSHIIGLDDAHRTIEVISNPSSNGKYSVGLSTPPPTNRDNRLEESLLTFVSKELGCDVGHVTRGENNADVSKLYEGRVQRIERLFREAEELKSGRPI